MPETSQRVGEYVLLKRIGRRGVRGGRHARHHAWTGQEVAVKIPTDAEYARQLSREGVAFHGLSHPNIVRPINFDPFADPPYLVMEYVPGVSLRTLLRRGRLRVDDAVAVTRHVLHALHHAHRNGIVHRDVKPENILVHQRAATEGLAADGVVKLSDFGSGLPAAGVGESIVLSHSTQVAAAGSACTWPPSNWRAWRRTRGRTCTPAAWCCLRC